MMRWALKTDVPTYPKLENVAIANALQLEVARRRASRSQLFVANCVLRMRINCYFAASDEIPTSSLNSANPIS